MTSNVASNVVALPGIGIGPHTPVRAAAGASKTEVENQDGHRGKAAKDGPQQAPANYNVPASKPNSPVALNSLLAAQEAGAQEAPAEPEPNHEQNSGHEQSSGQPTQLNEAEQKQVEQLKKNDAEIRRHEQAHAAARGQYAGAPQYSYTNGPDGKRYANAGLVSIDVSPVAGDPKATIEKMDVVQRAANAPAEPSGADRSVSAKAAAAKQAAQIELTQLKADEASEARGDGDEAPATLGIPKTDDAPAEAGESRTNAATQAKTAAVSHAAAAAAYAAPLNAIAGS